LNEAAVEAVEARLTGRGFWLMWPASCTSTFTFDVIKIKVYFEDYNDRR